MLILLLMCARLSWPSRQLSSARKSTLSYRIVSYWLSVYTARKTPSLCCDVGFTYKCMMHECSFALWYCLCRRPVTYLRGARVSVLPLAIQKMCPSLRSGVWQPQQCRNNTRRLQRSTYRLERRLPWPTTHWGWVPSCHSGVDGL